MFSTLSKTSLTLLALNALKYFFRAVYIRLILVLLRIDPNREHLNSENNFNTRPKENTKRDNNEKE